MQALISLLLIVLSIIGIADAGFITYEEINNIVPPCGNGFDCETVLTSKYAHIGPVPISALGLMYYITMLVLSVLNYLDVNLQKVPFIKTNTHLKRLSVIDLLLLFSGLGFIFSLYLVILMAFILQAWCKYCLLSALSSTLLFVAVQFYHHKFSAHSAFIAKFLVLKKIHILYGIFGKPLFFLFDPETVHDTITKTGRAMGTIPFFRFFTRLFFAFEHPVLRTKRNNITFNNPVGLSAGYDYEGDLTQIIPEVGFGFHTIGTVTLEPYAGNDKPRLGRFPNSKAILVNKGLKSIGADAIIKKLEKVTFHIPTGISIGSTNKGYHTDKEQILDIVKCFSLFEKSSLKHSYYEMNISCPNTFGGEPFCSSDRLESLLSALDKLKIKRPVFVKMPIDQSEKESLQLLKVIDKHAVQGLIIGNLTKDRDNPAVLPEDRKEWKKKKGNVSGKPTFERSNRLISLAKKQYGNRFTIIGTGGIFTAEDAWKKMRLGADLVQLITGMIFEGPASIGLINRGLADKLLDKSAK
ncbi:MAG: hypothetical protein QG639_461 [Patescibacteria group bacterium]|nr:hypothetical protein [Patescibacteria group bacterium]